MRDRMRSLSASRLLSYGLLAALATVVVTRTASAQAHTAEDPHDAARASGAPATEGPPAAMPPELPANAHLSFYATGGFFMALGTGLQIYSATQLAAAFQRDSVDDEATNGIALGAETLLSIAGVAFTVIGAVVQSSQNRSRVHAAHAFGGAVAPIEHGRGAAAVLMIAF